MNSLINIWWNKTLSEENRKSFKRHYYGPFKDELKPKEIEKIFNGNPRQEPSYLTN